MDKAYIREAIKHGNDVLDIQPEIDFDSLMLHVESNYPDLSCDEELDVRAALVLHFPNVVPGVYVLTNTGSGHHMLPLGDRGVST